MNQYRSRGVFCSLRGRAAILLAFIGFLAWPSGANSATQDSRATPLSAGQARQPWGKGELGATNAGGTATFTLKEPGSATFHMVSGEVLLPESGASWSSPMLRRCLNRTRRGRARASRSSWGAEAGEPYVFRRHERPHSAWLPFAISRMGDTVAASVGSVALTNQASTPASADQALVIALKGELASAP